MRCCVCGWADADDDHERAHLRSQYDYLKGEVARLRAEAQTRHPEGGNIVTYTKRELLHTALAVGVTVVVAVAPAE